MSKENKYTQEQEDAIFQLTRNLGSVIKYVKDLDVTDVITKFVTNGGYDRNLSVQSNAKVFLQALAVKLSLKH